MQRLTAVVCFAADTMIHTKAMMKASVRTMMFTRTLEEVSTRTRLAYHYQRQMHKHVLLSVCSWLLLVHSKEPPSLHAKQDNADASEQVGAEVWDSDCHDVRCSEGEHASEQRNDRKLCEYGVDADIAVEYCSPSQQGCMAILRR